MAEMTYPKVSIIILNWNGLEDTIECLESLKQITYPNYDVIVVDNGSQGNDVPVLKEKFGDYISLIENDRNYGFAGGNNIGIRYALSNRSPDYILLLNNDTVVDPEFLIKPTQLQDVGSKINLWKGEVVHTPRVVAERIKRVEFDRGQYDSIKEVDAVAGCCFLIKKGVLESIGLLDENLAYWEDTDYCLRAKRAGCKTVYVPAAKVWHKLGQSVKKISGLSCYYGVRSRLRFARKHATRWQYRYFLIYFFGFYFWLATGYYLIIERNLKLLLAFWRGAKDGLFNTSP